MEIIKALEDLEITLLLEAIFQRFGDDFRAFKKESVRQKLYRFMQVHNIATISGLQDLILHDATYINALLYTLDAREVELFDHPHHLVDLRKLLVPWLRSCPAPKIWINNCTCSEDVYSIAILLEEENLHCKTQIFATGTNAILLDEARQGRFTLAMQARYQENYKLAGGTRTLADYYDQIDGVAVFRPDLGRNITWAQYNLSTDASFNEFELIICRGGMADYANRLRRRVLQLFHDSLSTFGILSLQGADYADLAPLVSHYKAISPKQGIYQRV